MNLSNVHWLQVAKTQQNISLNVTLFNFIFDFFDFMVQIVIPVWCYNLNTLNFYFDFYSYYKAEALSIFSYRKVVVNFDERIYDTTFFNRIIRTKNIPYRAPSYLCCCIFNKQYL